MAGVETLPWWPDDGDLNLHDHVLRMSTDHPLSDSTGRWHVVGKCRCGNFKTPSTLEDDVMGLFNRHMSLVQSAIHYAAPVGHAVRGGAVPPPVFLHAMLQASGYVSEPTYGPPSPPNG